MPVSIANGCSQSKELPANCPSLTGSPRIIAPTAAPCTKATRIEPMQKPASHSQRMRVGAVAELEGHAAKDQARPAAAAPAGRTRPGTPHRPPGRWRTGWRRRSPARSRCRPRTARWCSSSSRACASSRVAAEEDADAEVEAVEHHVDQDRERDHRGPEQRQLARLRAGSWLRCRTPVALAASSAKASGRLPVAPGIASRRAGRALRAAACRCSRCRTR